MNKISSIVYLLKWKAASLDFVKQDSHILQSTSAWRQKILRFLWKPFREWAMLSWQQVLWHEKQGLEDPKWHQIRMTERYKWLSCNSIRRLSQTWRKSSEHLKIRLFQEEQTKKDWRKLVFAQSYVKKKPLLSKKYVADRLKFLQLYGHNDSQW